MAALRITVYEGWAKIEGKSQASREGRIHDGLITKFFRVRFGESNGL